MILGVTAALATPLEAYPRRAAVSLPDGPARIHLPLELRSAADPPDGTDLLLVNGAGDEIPVVRTEGEQRRASPVPADVVPTGTPGVFEVTPSGPVDRLSVDLPRGVPSATVTLQDGDEILAGPETVWRDANGSRLTVGLPRREDPFLVVVDARRVGALARTPPGLSFERVDGERTPPDFVPVTLEDPAEQENGWARWTIHLPRPIPADRVSITTSDPNLDREAGLLWLPLFDGGPTGPEAVPGRTGRLFRRTSPGGRVREDLVLPTPAGDPTDGLLLLVRSDDQPFPALTGAALQVDGVTLFVPDPGPGPHWLYVGAPPGTSPRWDEGDALDLFREDAPLAEPSEPEPNPVFRPIESRAELFVPGRALDPTDFHRQRAVEGEGLVRIPLPPEVLAAARSDLADLRLVDPGGRQVPYLVRRTHRPAPLGGVTTERAERGARSVIGVELPTGDLAAVTLALRTEAMVFDRRVFVSATRPHRVLRSLRWQGGGEAPSLVTEVPGPVPRRLEVEIENGDNGPLPVTVEVWTDGVELVAVLPPGGTRLWYDGPSVTAPRYDVAALDLRYRTELLQRALQEAALGPERPTAQVALRWFDRVLLGLGIAVFAGGLLVLLVDLLRKLPPPASPAEEGPAPPADPAAPPPPPDGAPAAG